MFFKPKKMDDFSYFFYCTFTQREGPLMTTQNSTMITEMSFEETCYLFHTVEDCANFWSQGLTGEDLDDSILNILGDDGVVRTINLRAENGKVAIVHYIQNDEGNGEFHFELIDMKWLEFVRMDSIEAEISMTTYNLVTITAVAPVYYPVFRLKEQKK